METPRTEIEAIAGTKDIRQYLHHVYMDRTNNRLIATNGSAMAIVPVAPESFSPEDTSGYLSLDAIKAARKVKHYAESPDALVANGSLTVLHGPTFQRPTEESEGKYPDVDRITHSQHAQAYIYVDAALLLQLAKAINNHGAKCQSVRIYLPYDGNTAMRVEPRNSEPGQGSFGYIMPVRGGKDEYKREVYPKQD